MWLPQIFKKEVFARIATVIFVIFTIWWIFERVWAFQDPGFESNFAHVYGFISIFGGIWGLSIAKKWGGFESAMGKALSFLSIGLLFQFFGQFAYSAYFFILHLEVPYPSIGDIGFFGSIAFYVLGVWNLATVSGVKIGVKSFINKLQAVFIPLILLLAAYFYFLQGYEFDFTQPVTVFLDFGYPLGQTFYISLAILTYLLSKNVLGGIMKSKILLILFALFLQFLADYTFLFQAYQETWHPGGINDYLYLLAYFVMTISLIQLKTVHDDLLTKN